MRGNGLWPLWFGAWFGFCLVLLFGLGLLVFFSPHHVVFPSPSMMTWALRPHGVRTRGKKMMEWPHWSAICAPAYGLTPSNTSCDQTHRETSIVYCDWEADEADLSSCRQISFAKGERVTPSGPTVTEGSACRFTSPRAALSTWVPTLLTSLTGSHKLAATAVVRPSASTGSRYPSH